MPPRPPGRVRRFTDRHQGVTRALVQERGLIVGAILLSSLAAAAEGVGITLLVPFLQNLTQSAEMPHARWALVDALLGVDLPPLGRLYRVSELIVATAWIRFLLQYLSQGLAARAMERVLQHVRLQGYDQLQAVALSFYSKSRSGELMNTLTAHLGQMRYLLQHVFQMLSRVFVMTAYVTCLLWLSWQLTLLALTLFTLVGASITSMVNRIRDSGYRAAQLEADYASHLAESIAGMRTTIGCDAHAFERQRFIETSETLTGVQVEKSRLASLVTPLAESLATTSLVLCTTLATRRFVLGGDMSVASLLTFLFLLLRLQPIAQQLNLSRTHWAAWQGMLEAVSDFLSRDGKPYLTDGEADAPSLRTAIELEHVHFAYPDGRRVLEDVSLVFTRGRITALVGASGAGKSTLADLLPRFHDPQSGRVLLDGRDVRELRLSSLRRRMAVVSQETFIFNDSVRANISYGRPDASLEQIRQAAEQAEALDFIMAMPQQFDTPLGDRGVRLSGGQRQRLAIARALLADPEILILDEATSALDSVAEEAVQRALEKLMKGRTVIVIAHRLSTIRNADLVVVLEGGRVAETGTYEELLGRRGHLWKYHALQFELT